MGGDHAPAAVVEGAAAAAAAFGIDVILTGRAAQLRPLLGTQAADGAAQRRGAPGPRQDRDRVVGAQADTRQADTQTTHRVHSKKKALPPPLPSGSRGPVPQIPLDSIPARRSRSHLREWTANDCRAGTTPAPGWPGSATPVPSARSSSSTRCCPPPGQGALAVECRDDDPELTTLLAAVSDEASMAAAVAERSLLEALAAGCSAPVGGYAAGTGQLLMRAAVLSPDERPGRAARPGQRARGRRAPPRPGPRGGTAAPRSLRFHQQSDRPDKQRE